jgi:endoglucanase
LRGSRLRAALVALAALLLVIPAVVALASGGGSDAGQSASGKRLPWIGVKGNRLVDGAGNPVRLLGVNRPGAEYRCTEGDGVFEGPIDGASIRAIKSWHVNVVRVPLNESCWLGLGRIEPHLSGEHYRAAIREYVQRLERAGLYVILDLHWVAPGKHTATGLPPMADADHAPDFWRSVASEYKDDRSVLFDLFNEPHDISWECWRSGCEASDNWFGGYRAAGMQELVDAVRSTGARQPLLLAGLDWSRDLESWLEYLPTDPVGALVASNHTYDFNACYGSCRTALVRISRRFPVVTSELGEGDCTSRYIDPYMRWADRHGLSYLGWAWYTADDTNCYSGPTLIRDYAGAPTRFGKGLREHLRELHGEARR